MRRRKMPEPYRIADVCLEALSRLILKRTETTRRKLSLLKFDELNVMKETDTLYAQFATDIRMELKALYGARYMEVWEALKGEYPDDDTVDELVEMYLAGLWDEPNEATHYAFGPELQRKRDRAKEAISAVPTQTQKQLELAKAGRYVIQQSSFYVDMTSQAAEIQALKDAGVKKVIRIEQDDEKTCALCRKLNGKVYEIDKIPPLEHLRCRRAFWPV